jgi:hypothetical protein
VADDETLSTNELIGLIGESLGIKTRILKISKPVVGALAKTGDMLHLPLNSERLKKLTESYVVSNEKLKSALGIEKLPITAREGLLKTLGSFGGPGLRLRSATGLRLRSATGLRLRSATGLRLRSATGWRLRSATGLRLRSATG